jgi:hypothetical protein
MPPLIVRPSKLVFGLLLLLCLPFVLGGGVLLFTLDDSREVRAVAFLAVAFFGGMAGFGLWQMLWRKPRMVLSDEGLNDYNLRMGVIPWSEILQAYEAPVLWYKNVELKLRNPEQYRQRQPGLLRALGAYNAALGVFPFTLYMSNTDTKAKGWSTSPSSWCGTGWPPTLPPRRPPRPPRSTRT